MGMAASQARLLALTSRMHDIELRAQNIESQKLSLATQQDEAYQKYCDAMDSKKIQIACQNGLGTSYIDATFSSMCGWHNSDGRARQYALVNNMTGKLIVDEETKNVYDEYKADKYTFALAMLGYEGDFDWELGGPFICGQQTGKNVGIAAGNNLHSSGFEPNFFDGLLNIDYTNFPAWGTTSSGENDIYMTESEYLVFISHVESDATLETLYQNLLSSTLNGDSKSKRQECLDEFRDHLYSNYAVEIFNMMNLNKNDAPYGYDVSTGNFDIPIDTNDNDTDHNHEYSANGGNREFNYYVQLWEQINACGGCEIMEQQYASGDDGVEWLTNMVSAGLVSILVLDPSNMHNEFELTTIATSYQDNYLQEADDEKKIKKAEVEYEHELKVINRKDTKFDTQLKKLETEESACKNEIDSLKKVKDDNIDRTFNLFS